MVPPGLRGCNRPSIIQRLDGRTHTSSEIFVCICLNLSVLHLFVCNCVYLSEFMIVCNCVTIIQRLDTHIIRVGPTYSSVQCDPRRLSQMILLSNHLKLGFS